MKEVLKALACVLVAVMLFAVQSYATSRPKVLPHEDTWKVYEWSWTGDGSGDYSDATATSGDTKYDVTGTIMGVYFYCSGCSDDYDVTITNSKDVDVLMGDGADRTATESATTNFMVPLNTDSQPVTLFREDLDLTVANSGATKSGTVKLIVR